MMEADLTGVPETLLTPPWARAAETRRPDAIVRDELAVEMLARIDYDLSKLQGARLSQLGVAVRTMLLDRAAQAFLDQNPRACVINLGVGLDTRHALVRAGSSRAPRAAPALLRPPPSSRGLVGLAHAHAVSPPQVRAPDRTPPARRQAGSSLATAIPRRNIENHHAF